MCAVSLAAANAEEGLEHMTVDGDLTIELADESDAMSLKLTCNPGNELNHCHGTNEGYVWTVGSSDCPGTLVMHIVVVSVSECVLVTVDHTCVCWYEFRRYGRCRTY